jgi:hypothetical protein
MQVLGSGAVLGVTSFVLSVHGGKKEVFNNELLRIPTRTRPIWRPGIAGCTHSLPLASMCFAVTRGLGVIRASDSALCGDSVALLLHLASAG